MKNVMHSLRYIAVASIFLYSLAIACSSGSYTNSGSANGDCFDGPHSEGDPEEFTYVQSRNQVWDHNEPCTPDNNWSDWDADATEMTITVNPWEQWCGHNSWSDRFCTFLNYGPENCVQYGYDRHQDDRYNW